VVRQNWGEGSKDEFSRTVGAMFGGERVKLTSAGLDEFDRAQRGPTEHLPHINYHGIIVMNSPGAVAVLENYGIDPEQLTIWMEKYGEWLRRESDLSNASMAHAAELLEELRAASDKGDGARVRRLGRTLQAILEGAAGHATGSAVYESLLRMAERLGFG
jgi:hypothetical protein